MPRLVGSALAGAMVTLLLAEMAVRALLTTGIMPPEPGWLADEYPTRVAAMEALAAEGGAGTVVLGSSVAATGIDPARLDTAVSGDRPVYNAGLLGPTPTIVEGWSAGWVEPLLEPDTVVFVLSSRDLNANAPGLVEHEKQWAQGLWVRERIGSASPWQRAQRWLTERSALLTYRSVLRRPVASILKASRPPVTPEGLDTHLLEEDYRIETVLAALQDPEADAEANTLLDFAIDTDRLASLETLLRRLTDDGVRVVLVDAPVTIDYPRLHPRGADDYREYRAVVEDLARRTGVELVIPGLWELDGFADPVHLNGAGTRRLTALVETVLATEPTNEGGPVDPADVPGLAELLGPADPGDPDVPGPATIPPEGPAAVVDDDSP